MFNKVISGTALGIDGALINVEADLSEGLPMLTMIGYLSSSVKEAGERVRTALKNSGYYIPPKRITINLSPADIRKDGSGFDLPIAIAIVLSIGKIPEIDISETIIIGELGLNGEVKPVNGILPVVYYAFENGINTCIVPKDNAMEAALVEGMKVIGVESLSDAIDYIQGNISIETFDREKISNDTDISPKQYDFSEIKGQAMLKRGMEIAVSGFHNVLMMYLFLYL